MLAVVWQGYLVHSCTKIDRFANFKLNIKVSSCYCYFLEYSLDVMALLPIKCLLVGDKDNKCVRELLFTYTTGVFPAEYVPSFFDSRSVTIKVFGEPYNIQLVDATEYENNVARSIAYTQTDVFMVCFSVVDRFSFLNAKEKWIPEIRHHFPKVPFLLVGTQIDMRTHSETLRHRAEVSFGEGMAVARRVNASKYLECSALTQKGLKNVFIEAAIIGLEGGGKLLSIISLARYTWTSSLQRCPD